MALFRPGSVPAARLCTALCVTRSPLVLSRLTARGDEDGGHGPVRETHDARPR